MCAGTTDLAYGHHVCRHDRPRVRPSRVQARQTSRTAITCAGTTDLAYGHHVCEEGTPEKIQRRRKRKKRNIGNSSQEKGDARGGDTVAKQDKEKQNLTVKVSKNKKRKLKKKRHKEKLRSAGMIPKSMAVEFTYQPGESSSEDEDLDATERKAAEVLDFLQATQEIYFADRTSPVSEPMVPPATVGGILNNLYTRTVPSSDVAVLYELKSLVLLQDIEMLKSALEEFQDNSMMPPEVSSK
ncbi:glutamate-rich protein 1 [Huso huso]|uniref:Glutamate-rich protein 1 n=1 Tax=Huso huso TaxID=61971 RepID=A0ABR0ZYZ2_HUSHU